MKTIFFFLFTFLLSCSLQAQHIVEISYWKYTNGLNSKQKKQSYYLEKYNENHVLFEKATFIYNDSIYDRTVYIYNDKKQKIAEEDYVRTHKLIVKRNYTYDDNGLLQMMYWRGRNKMGDSLTWRQQYFYDSSGRMVKMMETTDGYTASLITHRYEYENKGDAKMVTESVLSLEKKKVKKKISIYNSKGLLIKVTYKGLGYLLDYNGDVMYEYELDAQGNWIKQKVGERLSAISPWIWVGEYRKKKLL
jgi:hypothetical protein